MNNLIKENTAGNMEVQGEVAVFTFSGSGHNTFATWKMNEIAETLENLDTSSIRAVIITAGEGRSFGVGGDFHEVNTFKGSDEVDKWIAACVRMYTSVLALSVPVIAALDGYSIGIGLQLALCADYRVASHIADLRMPELKLGIACVLGSCLLNERVAPHVVNRMIMTCEPWLAPKAFEDGLVDVVASENESVLEKAKTIAQQFSKYQPVPFKTTKRYANAGIIERLEHARIEATRAHRAGFAASQSAQERMREVINS